MNSWRKKVKSRNRHIIVEALGNILAIIVHQANLHNTKVGIAVAKLAVENYPSIQDLCVDAGYRRIFEADVARELR